MDAANPRDITVLVERISVELVRDEDRDQNEAMHRQTVYLERHALQGVSRVAEEPAVPLVDAFELPLRKVAESIDQDQGRHGMLVWHLQAPAQDL